MTGRGGEFLDRPTRDRSLAAMEEESPERAGEHTRAMLAQTLGYTKKRIDALLQSGAAAQP
jgi:crotonobetainyl-CoA:carnitine CoA-transferase CaiB-like acyl-CoA transferase